MPESKQDIMSLASQLGKYDGMPSRLPPVDQWNPDLSGDMDMVITSGGAWIHEGDPIRRDKLVRLFSTILKREGDEYFLVTPVEKWRIKVESTPFQIVLAQIIDQGGANQSIRLITNTGDEFELEADHALFLNEDGLPEVEVRSQLNASLNRNVYYQLAEIANEEEGGFFFFSNGAKQQIG